MPPAETYCMEWLEWDGRYCRARIPKAERVCSDCLRKLRERAAGVFVKKNGLDAEQARAIANETGISELRKVIA